MQRKNFFSAVLLILFTVACLSTALLSVTVSRYVSKETAKFEGSEHLDYTVNSVFVVRNQEELFAAINQGYTYVQLDKNIENPLIVTQKAETLDADLILDLNGIEIQRNGYEPILNIKQGVRLTVVDTSTEQTGGLYNPVGSVFNITGGTLTVVTGHFESGPRYSEYYTYNNGVLNATNGSTTKRTTIEPGVKTVDFYQKKTGDGATGFDHVGERSVPIIKSYPEKTGDVEYNHGNLYFDELLNVAGSDLIIKPDTYCYYQTSEDAASDLASTAMADWYYTYYVTKDGFNYVGINKSNDTDVQITIYGYEKVISQADNMADPSKYYAAVQMQAGKLDIQNGAFNQYFGVDKTACVNARGGEITVKKGKFSSRVPNATGYTQNGVNIKEIDTVCFETPYFDNFKWNQISDNYIYDTTYNGRLAKKGESYCILNSGDAQVSIGTGELYSSNNSIIGMENGTLSILGGNFTKRITNGLETDTAQEMAAIYMENGLLTVANASCEVVGGHPTANIYGIYSLVDGTSNFNVQNTSFTMTEGDRQYGIYAEKGRVNVFSDTAATISLSGENSYGIYVTNGGSVNSQSYSYALNGAGSVGIYSAIDGAINVENGQMNIKGDSSYGIKSYVQDAVDVDRFTVKNLLITMTDGDEQYGIYAENGTVNISATDGVNDTITIDGEKAYGIYVTNGGKVDSQNYSYTLNGAQSIGIFSAADGAINVENGQMNIKGDGSFGIQSYVSGNDSFNVENLSITMTDGDGQTGIYSENGRVNISSDDGVNNTITIVGNGAHGIDVRSGGSVASTDYSYYLTGDDSIGILADSGATGINVTNGEMSIGGTNTYGIKSSITGTDKFIVTDLPITMTDGTAQTGIYSANGKVTVKATSTASITTTGANGKGIYVLDGGSVDSTNYSYILPGAGSVGIDAEIDAVSINAKNGDMQIKGDNSFGIRSYIDDGGTNNKFMVTNIAITMTDGDEQTGIFSENGRVNVSADSQTLISIDGISGKGIHVSSGGSVVSKNYSYRLKGATSYGIYSTAGLVDVSGGNITLDSNVSCYGVYARSNTEAISINLTDGDVSVGYNAGGTKSGTVAASVGVFMATNNNANTVNITRSRIYSYEVGIALDGGSLNVKETATVLTRKASSIVVLGGNLNFAESTAENDDGGVGAGFSYVLSSSNTRETKAMTAANRNTLLGYYTNSYNLTLPTAYGGTQNYANRDGVYVEGGSLDILGKVKIEHAGLANNIYTSGTTKYTRYDQVVINSYAVAVSGGNVNIRKAEITAHVGGGVSCSDGNITLGASDSLTNNDDITVLAKGNITDDANSTSNQGNQTNYNSIGTYVTVGWMNERSVTGGNAVALIGGNITVYGGYFEATFGNGVSATVPTSFTSGQDGGTINVLGGTFFGWHNDDDNDLTNARKSGPAAHYGLKVIGGCNVNIYDGTFDGGNGGALVTGINKFTSRSDISSTNNKYATVRVYAGKFGDFRSATPANLDGFNVYDMSDVVFGAHPANTYASANEYANAIVIYAQNAAIATNPITEATTRIGSTVRVYYGSYHPVQTATEAGNWNSNATCTFYNTGTNHTLYFIASEYINNFNIANNQTAQFYVA